MIRILTLLYLVLIVVYIQAQDNRDISRLETLLFEYDKDKPLYEYPFWSRKLNKTIMVYSRFEADYKKYKQDSVSNICDDIRRQERIDLIPNLQEILQRHESYFLKEWEPVWDHRGGPEGLWEDQYNILCIIDMTINYLKMIKEKWSSDKKYKYLKNIYMLNYGDYDTTRVTEVKYNSAYIRNQRKYCRCKQLQRQVHQKSLISEMFLGDKDMISFLIKDLLRNEDSNVSDDEGRFFSQGMDYVLRNVYSEEIDSLILNRPNVFINSGYKHPNELSKSAFSLRFYHLVLRRYKATRSNYRLVQLLLDDLFSDRNILYQSRHALGIIQGNQDVLIRYMLMDEFIQLFASSKSQEELDRLESFITQVYSPYNIKMLKDRAKKYSSRDKLSLSTLKQIENM